MDTKTLKKAIKINYPELLIPKIMPMTGHGITNSLFIIRNQNKKYIAKIYRGNNLKKIKSEHIIISKLRKKLSGCPSLLLNHGGLSYSRDKKTGIYFCIYEFKEGRSSRSVNIRDIKLIGKSLVNLHNVSDKISSKKQIIIRHPRKEFSENLKKLEESLLLLNGKKKLNRKDEIIKKVISRKFEILSSSKISQDLAVISRSSKGIIHGDFSSHNLVFNKNKIVGILDWENACIYQRVWEIFRTMCLVSKIGNKGLICSKLNLKKAEEFLKYYKKERNLSAVDLRALRLMVHYYFFLDTYILSSYVLEKNKSVSDLISENISDHFWLDDNYKKIINII